MEQYLERVNQLVKILNVSSTDWLEAQRDLETPGKPNPMPLMHLASEKRQAATELAEILTRMQIEIK